MTNSNRETMEKINLNNYIQTGEGANGVSYVSKTDPDEMVKLYSPSFKVENIYGEYENSRKLYSIGVQTPEPGTIVTDGERTGIRFRRIVGKRSYARMFADEPARTDEFAREMARECKKFHSITPPEGLFINVKDDYLRMLDSDRTMTQTERRKMADVIGSRPDAATLLHGDMHFGNIISTLPAGAPLSEPHKVYFIDLQSVSCGHPLFDLGMLYLICHVCDEDFRFQNFHITSSRTVKVWDSFVDEYFFAEDNLAEKFFGPGQTPESVTEEIIPYTCIKFLLVGYNLNGELPDMYMNYVRENFFTRF